MASRFDNRSTYFPGSSSTTVDGQKASSFMRMSPGLLRARQPFLVRNIFTGLLISSFAAGVYFYSIAAVKQDDFTAEDINALIANETASNSPIASNIAREPQQQKGKQEQRIQGVVDLEASIMGGGPLGSRPPEPATEKSIRQQLSPSPPTYQTLFSQTWGNVGFRGKNTNNSVIVIGAPNVDAVGKIGDRTSANGNFYRR